MQTQCVVCARPTAVGWSESHQQIFRSYSSRSLQDMFICWCNTLQDTATLCITLNQPVTAPDCNISVHDLLQVGRRGIYWSVDAIHCNALQRSASHCTSRHHSATNQCATYCSTPKQREKWYCSTPKQREKWNAGGIMTTWDLLFERETLPAPLIWQPPPSPSVVVKKPTPCTPILQATWCSERIYNLVQWVATWCCDWLTQCRVKQTP